MFSNQNIQWLANPNYILVSGCGEGHEATIRYKVDCYFVLAIPFV